MTATERPDRSEKDLTGPASLTSTPPVSRKISDEKSTSCIRVSVAVVFAQSMSALPEATIAIRSETVPGIQLVLRSDTPVARESCAITFLQRSIEYPMGSPLLSLMKDNGNESADTATLICLLAL